MREADIGWLAGIIDGEGCIYLRYHQTGIGSSLHLHIANTSLPLLEKALRLMHELGAGPKVQIRDLNRRQMKPQWKNKYQIAVTQRRQVIPILLAVLPHLSEKKAFCEAVLNFYAGRPLNAWWTQEEVDWLEQIRKEFGRTTTA